MAWPGSWPSRVCRWHRCATCSSRTNIPIANEGRVPLAPLVRVHEVREGGPVMADDNLRVTATLVDHPPVVPSFAYRFDAVDRSIVISGDTAPSQNLVKLAAGADEIGRASCRERVEVADGGG